MYELHSPIFDYVKLVQHLIFLVLNQKCTALFLYFFVWDILPALGLQHLKKAKLCVVASLKNSFQLTTPFFLVFSPCLSSSTYPITMVVPLCPSPLTLPASPPLS